MTAGAAGAAAAGAGADAGAADVSVAPGVVDSPAGFGVSEAALAAFAAGFCPSRKSVTYQPEPFNWKPAAVTCFVYAAALQAGHTVSTGSDIFCRTSCAWPQLLQR